MKKKTYRMLKKNSFRKTGIIRYRKYRNKKSVAR